MGHERDELTGKAKKMVGDMTGDRDLEMEGRHQEMAGKVKSAAEKVKDSFENVVDKVKDKVTDR